jgi:hypothetical protein
MTAQSVAQDNTLTSDKIVVVQLLSGANSTQTATSAAGAITQFHQLLASSAAQINLSNTGPIFITGVLNGANSAQSNLSPGVAVEVYQVVNAPVGSGYIAPIVEYWRPAMSESRRPARVSQLARPSRTPAVTRINQSSQFKGK